MLRKLLGAALVLIALDGLAYPTKAELREASPLVTDLMAKDVADFKAKKKTAEEVGDAAAGYVRKASGEAAKLLFFRGAFHYYMLGKSYDKATRTLKDMQAEITEMDLGQLIDLIKREARTVNDKDAPQLLAHYRLLRVQAAAKEELRKTRLALRSSPTDKDLTLRLGEAQAITGDWEAALETFARFKAGVGPHARAEKLGRDLLKAADFWWAYESYASKDATPIFRQHAAKLYRLVLTRGEADGLRKDVIQTRLAQMIGDDGASSPVGSSSSNGAGLYMVVDLSSGSDSGKYPISWLQKMPAGGWTDEYKTTKLVLRRIEPGSYIMGDNQNDESHRVTITKPFYIGVFEVTQKQWELVKGDRPSFWRGSCWATRPVDNVRYNTIRGKDKGAKWPVSSDVDDGSFLGILRARTQLTFDLPTEGQWEYACRAGTTGDYNAEGGMAKLGRCRDTGSWNEAAWGKFDWKTVLLKADRNCGADHGTAPAGSYAPNAWGLYDCHGNVWEWCLDWKVDHRAYGNDPVGGASGGSRVIRGGCWSHDARGFRSTHRYWWAPGGACGHFGFRLSCSAGPRK